MKGRADNAEQIQLAAVTQAVDQAVAERRILAGAARPLYQAGQSAGVRMLQHAQHHAPQQKPSEVINLGKQSAPGAGEAPKTLHQAQRGSQAERLNSARITAPNICACSRGVRHRPP